MILIELCLDLPVVQFASAVGFSAGDLLDLFFNILIGSDQEKRPGRVLSYEMRVMPIQLLILFFVTDPYSIRQV